MKQQAYNVIFGVIAIVAMGTLLIYHARGERVKAKGPLPDYGAVPNTDASYAALPDYLTYNQPPQYGTTDPPPSFIPDYGAADTSINAVANS